MPNISTSLAPIGEILTVRYDDEEYRFAHPRCLSTVDATLDHNMGDWSDLANKAAVVFAEAMTGGWDDLRPVEWTADDPRGNTAAFVKDMERRMSIAGKKRVAESEGVMSLFGDC